MLQDHLKTEIQFFRQLSQHSHISSLANNNRWLRYEQATLLWNKQQFTNYMGKFWRGTYVAQLCISGQKQLNTDWRLYQVSQIGKKQHFTRFTTQPGPFQALLIIVKPNHHCLHRSHHSYHHDTHISDPFPLLVDAPHLTNAVPIAGSVLKKKENQFGKLFRLFRYACWKKKVNLVNCLDFFGCACWRKKVNLQYCLGVRAEKTWLWISCPGNLKNGI